MHWEIYVLTENSSYMKIKWNDLQEYFMNNTQNLTKNIGAKVIT